MSTYELATVHVLWRRDLKRLLRQPARIAGALGQPLIFWLVIGSGMAATFSLTGGANEQPIAYEEYFYPGVVAMILLFASIFATVSVIEDRHQGFLQSVLAGPASRAALVFGKCAGSTSVALLQAALFLLLAPLAGFSYSGIQWPLLLVAMVTTSFGLTAMGFAVAWYLDNFQAYHAIMMTILIPLWVISGAMFPASEGQDVFAVLMAVNPVAYAVSAFRHALYGGVAPHSTVLIQAPWLDVGIVAGFAVLCFAVAVWVCEYRRG